MWSFYSLSSCWSFSLSPPHPLLSPSLLSLSSPSPSHQNNPNKINRTDTCFSSPPAAVSIRIFPAERTILSVVIIMGRLIIETDYQLISLVFPRSPWVAVERVWDDGDAWERKRENLCTPFACWWGREKERSSVIVLKKKSMLLQRTAPNFLSKSYKTIHLYSSWYFIFFPSSAHMPPCSVRTPFFRRLGYCRLWTFQLPILDYLYYLIIRVIFIQIR